MEPFLSLVAKHLYEFYGNSISDITLVFPNRRASLFFTRYLAEQLNGPTWQPQVTTINNLMFGIAGLKSADPLLLNLKLYRQYLNVTGNQESFDDFHFWGNVMISDFDQVDKYLVDPAKLFTNVKDLKEIDKRFDEFDEEHLRALQTFMNILGDSTDSQIRSRYSAIWEKLGSIYRQFTDTLLAEGTAYEGLAYRVAASKLKHSTSLLVDGKFALIGFNALNSCERILFNHLKHFVDALFYWDYDKYYLQSNFSQNEAAMFMSDNLKEFPNSLGPEHFENFSKEKNIYLIASPSNVTQAKLIPTILAQITNRNSSIGINTAVVLPEEQLLLPTLSALPTDLSDVNITMEYPIRNTAAYSLTDTLISLQADARQSENSTKFYHRDTLNILAHPYIRYLAGADSQLLINSIVEKKAISIESEFFEGNPLLAKIFTPASNSKQLLEYLISTLKNISNGLSRLANGAPGNVELELEFLFTIYKALIRLQNVLPEFDVDINHKTFRSLFRKAMTEQRVSFSGEPLSGVQLMGFLETRSLDFENVIILSMNDNVLPGATHKPSFITPSLRFAYGLPDYRHQNAIYAYYFYRLIQRAENIYLTYADKTEGTRSGEMSRFVLQLVMESDRSIQNIKVKFDLGLTPEPAIFIKKSEKIISILSKYIAENGKKDYLSPTALASYKNCPLRFFFSKIAGIEEPDEMEEAVDERGAGTILHRAVELVYQSIGTSVTPQKLGDTLSNTGLINSSVRTAFAETYKVEPGKIDGMLIGRNALILERVKWMISQIIAIDKNRAPYSIVSTEQEAITEMPINRNGEIVKVKIGGRFDRIEQAGKYFRIVDFKTGRYADTKIRFGELSDLLGSKDLDGIFQIFTYCVIFEKVSKTPPNRLTPNLWFARRSGGGYLPTIYQAAGKRGNKLEIQEFEPYSQPFKLMLQNIISEIFDPNVDFAQTSKAENCRVCPYKQICGRTNG
ncbi:MAG: PD-(D/E)XK nuclease family protein [Bacteroidales bacterium]